MRSTPSGLRVAGLAVFRRSLTGSSAPKPPSGMQEPALLCCNVRQGNAAAPAHETRVNIFITRWARPDRRGEESQFDGRASSIGADKPTPASVRDRQMATVTTDDVASLRARHQRSASNQRSKRREAGASFNLVAHFRHLVGVERFGPAPLIFPVLILRFCLFPTPSLRIFRDVVGKAFLFVNDVSGPRSREIGRAHV